MADFARDVGLTPFDRAAQVYLAVPPKNTPSAPEFSTDGE